MQHTGSASNTEKSIRNQLRMPSGPEDLETLILVGFRSTSRGSIVDSSGGQLFSYRTPIESRLSACKSAEKL